MIPLIPDIGKLFALAKLRIARPIKSAATRLIPISLALRISNCFLSIFFFKALLLLGLFSLSFIFLSLFALILIFCGRIDCSFQRISQ